MNLRSLGRYLPVASTLTVAALMLLPDAAFAGNAGAGMFTSINTQVQAAIGFLTGPIMQLVAIIAIISGAFMLIQGRELGEGVKVFAILAVTIGLLIGATGIMAQVPGASIAMISSVGLF